MMNSVVLLLALSAPAPAEILPRSKDPLPIDATSCPCEDGVSSDDRHRFPDWYSCCVQIKFLKERLVSLKLQQECYGDEWHQKYFDRALVDANWRLAVWNELQSAQWMMMPCFSSLEGIGHDNITPENWKLWSTVSARYLKNLKVMLGSSAYEFGAMPEMVPFEFRHSSYEPLLDPDPWSLVLPDE